MNKNLVSTAEVPKISDGAFQKEINIFEYFKVINRFFFFSLVGEGGNPRGMVSMKKSDQTFSNPY